MPPLLSIIIVNYKTPQLLKNCLASIFREPATVSFEVIVVDNASGDNSHQEAIDAFPQVKWIQMDYNAGFARANNEGIRQSSGNTVLLLNSDTLNTNNAINTCYQLFSDSAYVACGAQLLNDDGSPQISGNYFMTGGLNNLLPLPYTGSFIKWLGGLFRVKKPHVPDADAEVKVDWINGAFLMVKKTAIEKAGLLDEDFFLYAEEAEWCGRLGKEGEQCIFGQCKIIHLQGESANSAFGSSGRGYYLLTDKKGFQIMLSNFVRIRKQYGIAWFLFHLMVYSFTIPIYALCSFIRNGLMGRNPVVEFAAVQKFSYYVFRIWGFSPVIIRNAPFFYKVL